MSMTGGAPNRYRNSQRPYWLFPAQNARYRMHPRLSGDANTPTMDDDAAGIILIARSGVLLIQVNAGTGSCHGAQP